MITYLSNKISKIFIRYGETTEENADIYAYAIEAILAVVVNVIICLAIAAIFGRVSEGFIFIFTFAVLRRFTGGYHANTHFKCILTFSSLLTVSLAIINLSAGRYAGIPLAVLLAMLAVLGSLMAEYLSKIREGAINEKK